MKQKILALILSFCALTVFAQKSRIICLSPSGYEILFSLEAQDKIIACTSECSFPKKLDIPSIGTFDAKTVSIETIMVLKPDLVYGSSGMHDFLVPVLKKHNIDIYLSKASDIKSIQDEISYIAELTGTQKKAVQVIESIRNAVLKYTRTPEHRPKVYCELWHNPYISIGKNSYISNMIEICGGQNIFENLEPAYPLVSSEAIIQLNPDIILLPADSSVVLEELMKRSGWKNISAVKNKKIYFFNSDDFARPGPRVIIALQQIQKMLWQNNE